MPQTNSVDKIVLNYMAAVCKEAFLYQWESGVPVMVQPKKLTVSQSIFKGYTCPEGCGACCPRFSLVYLPSEEQPYPLKPCYAKIDGRPILLFEDPQDYHKNHHCRHLDRSNGRCGIHGKHPFSCDFELIRVHMSTDTVRIGVQQYGRAWQMLRVVDQERGALCEITPPTEETKADTLRKLTRLKQWADHLRIETHLPQILEWVESGPHKEALRC
jgi:hypothetical protein